MSSRTEDEKGPAAHRDLLSPPLHRGAGVEPLPWTRLSRAQCMLLVLALHRSGTRGVQSVLNRSELFSSRPV